VRIAHLIEADIAERHAAARYLKQLAQIGVLAEEKRGRDKVFIHRKYMDLLGRDDHDFAPYERAAPLPSEAATSKKKAPRSR
jgi:hypothetical protein